MATQRIGTLKANDNGNFAITLKTMTQKIEGDLVRNKDKRSANSPDFTLFLSDRTQAGSGWEKTGEHGTFISLVLDDPFLPAPIHANSFTTDDGETVLLWDSKRSR